MPSQGSDPQLLVNGDTCLSTNAFLKPGFVSEDHTTLQQCCSERDATGRSLFLEEAGSRPWDSKRHEDVLGMYYCSLITIAVPL